MLQALSCLCILSLWYANNSTLKSTSATLSKLPWTYHRQLAQLLVYLSVPSLLSLHLGVIIMLISFIHVQLSSCLSGIHIINISIITAITIIIIPIASTVACLDVPRAAGACISDAMVADGSRACNITVFSLCISTLK